MVVKKKYTLIITYRQDKKKSNIVVGQNFLLRKTISKQVVVTSMIIIITIIIITIIIITTIIITIIIKVVPGNQTYAKTARNIQKNGIIGDSHIGRLNKRHLNEKINGKVYLMFFGVQISNVSTTASNLFFMKTNQMRC